MLTPSEQKEQQVLVPVMEQLGVEVCGRIVYDETPRIKLQ